MNARTEFINQVGNLTVLCAYVNASPSTLSSDGVVRTIRLASGYTDLDYKAFLEALDFTYDNGYGGQELFGEIWFKDGTWATRGEYDGSEWWQYHNRPDIPPYLGEGKGFTYAEHKYDPFDTSSDEYEANSDDYGKY